MYSLMEPKHSSGVLRVAVPAQDWPHDHTVVNQITLQTTLQEEGMR